MKRGLAMLRLYMAPKTISASIRTVERSLGNDQADQSVTDDSKG